MANGYKHKQLMVKYKVKEPCPFHNCKESELVAFHFGFDPVKDERNFVPGITRVQRINDANDTIQCRYCGLSMYKSEAGARNKWVNEIPARVRKLLSYTHLLVGEIKNEFGVVSQDKGEHFTLFEYEGVELGKSFKVHGTL